ncbi:MAG: CPBP family glutamic-type intramembrane protease, partial [Promethearchaeota archaeon]
YKKHFYLFFIASIISSGTLIAIFTAVGVVSWASTDSWVVSINLGTIFFAIASIILMIVIEKQIYVKDEWTLSRLGLENLSHPSSAKSLIAATLPLVLLILPFLDGTGFSLTSIMTGEIPGLWMMYLFGTIPLIIFEEIIFRGIYWKYMVMKYSHVRSMMFVHSINALLFAFIHLPRIYFQFVDSIYTGALYSYVLLLVLSFLIFLISGMILSILREYFKNILAPITFHLVFNIITIIITLNLLYLLLFQVAIFFTLILLKFIGLFDRHSKKKIKEITTRVAGSKEKDEIINVELRKELKKLNGRNVLDTKVHEWFRRVFFVGNALIILYYTVLIGLIDDITMIVLLSSAIPTLVVFGYLFIRKIWIFQIRV